MPYCNCPALNTHKAYCLGIAEVTPLRISSKKMQADDIDQTLLDLGKDYFFLFCVRYLCDYIYNVSQDRVVYHKDATVVAIMDIMERWTQFPNPAKILKMGMENIICLSFLKPAYMASKKSAIVRGMLYPIAHTYGLNDAEKEDLKQQFYGMVRRLLTESPTIATLSCLLEPLTFYFNEEDQQERALATSTIRELLAYALKFNNMTGEAINRILTPAVSELFNTINEADVLVEHVDVFPPLIHFS
ncbi:uncharacterized protein LOC118084299 [Zootoca vivipara]|uniref:uncharacterized protein LOC118084299 n=1 Tax=Zootoca vivipara TaxID=8524 RepID=UPI00293B9211|nr:uncharacterized protein LOC118084299 [Zootoca vivipara]